MTDAERKATRSRSRIWKEAEPLLEEQRWRELRALTDEKALSLTKALFIRGIGSQPRRDSSGLIQQQTLFRRLRSR